MKPGRPFRGTIADPDLRLLRVFLSVVECGGITPAAIETNVDRSTISKHLADLEVRFGMTLCERGRQGFALTPAGEKVLASTRNLLGAIDRFAGEIAEVHGFLGGKFFVAFADGLLENPAARLSLAFDRFRRMAPDVHVNITVSSANEIERGVAAGRFHVGIVPFHHALDGIEHQYVFAEDARLYCGRGHPLFDRSPSEVGIADIRGCAYIDWGYYINRSFFSDRLELSPAATVVNNEGAATLILTGHYIGFLPVHYARQWESVGTMRSLLPEIAYYRKPVACISKAQATESGVIAAFREILMSVHGHTATEPADARLA
jgi:DNA-binding transcriptional LysR family regulator